MTRLVRHRRSIDDEPIEKHTPFPVIYIIHFALRNEVLVSLLSMDLGSAIVDTEPNLDLNLLACHPQFDRTRIYHCV